MREIKEQGRRPGAVSRIKISGEDDCFDAASEGMRLAGMAGLDNTSQFMVATAVSELATNILRYAGEGEITIRVIEDESRKGVEVVARDSGPGIADVEAALKDGFSTTETSLGFGLGGARRLMDEFIIDTKAGAGTRIRARKWVRNKG